MADDAGSPKDSLVGQLLLGRFQVTGVGLRASDALGYDGIDTKTQKPVRIQSPKPLTLTPEQAAKVKGIGSAMLRLKAVPGVLGPVDGGIHAGMPFLVFPALSGGTLAERLRHRRDVAGGTASARSIRQWLKAVAATLDEAHKIGVFHGRLTADCIVVASDGSAHVDGLPLSKLLSVVGLGGGVSPAGDSAQSCRAPELVRGAAATAASDQYALAAVVAEALGCRPRAVEKALAERPDQRYPSCSDFASDLLADLESSPSGRTAAGASPSSGEGPLELAEPEASAGLAASGTQGRPADQSFQLELEEIDGESARRKARKTSDIDEGVDLGDITFTKPGQALLTPKTTYQKATDLGGVRAAWRRMGGGFKGLPARKQLIARVAVACVGLVVALWVVRAGWRAADWLVRSGRSAVQGVAGRFEVKPGVEAFRESSKEFVDRMRSLWEEHVADDEQPAATAVVAPVRPEGGAWPSRPQDKLTSDEMKEPNDLIDALVKNKGAFTNAGVGVFHVDDPKFADQQSWIGGFGLVRKGPSSSKPLLHGTLVHHTEDGDVFVARYQVGKILDFWCIERGPAKKNFVVYASLITKDDALVPDGAAFVLSPDRSNCLALVYQDGEAVGAQWCTMKRDKDGQPMFDPPTSRVDIDSLRSADERFTEYVERLDAALVPLPDIQKKAIAELRAYVRKRGLR